MGLVASTPDAIVAARERAATAAALESIAATRVRAPVETWHVVGAAGEPAFAGGFTAAAGYPVSFFRAPTGEVSFSGIVVAPSGGARLARLMFTLPEHYRPGHMERISVYAADISVPTNRLFDELFVRSNGEVRGCALYESMTLDAASFIIS